MARSRPATVLLLWCTVGLSGCLGGGQEAATPAGLSDAQGGIRGVLISEELFPVVGALVEIVGGPATESDAAGKFEFVNLPEGTVLINVSAEGYEPKQEKAIIPADGFAEVRIALIGIPGVSPYVVSLIHEGFVACSYSVVYSAGWLLPVCPIGESDDFFTTEVGAEWRAGVHEMEWQSGDEMLFASTLDGPACRAAPPPPSKCAAFLGGRSPLRALARPEDAAYASKYAIDGKVTWPIGNHSSTLYSSYSGRFRTEVNQTFNPACQEVNGVGGAPRSWGCPFGIGVSTGIRFRFYHTTFYLQDPDELETFSARPDG